MNPEFLPPLGKRPPIEGRFLGDEMADQSAIEEAFLWDFDKVANDKVSIERQYECDVGFTAYYLDFFVQDDSLGFKLGIECDGKEFHTIEKDSNRDAAILDSGFVDQIVRLPGKVLWYRIHDLLDMISLVHPWLFSDRGLINVRTRSAQIDWRYDYREVFKRGIYTAQVREYRKPNPDTCIDDRPARDFTPSSIYWTESARANIRAIPERDIRDEWNSLYHS